MLKSTEKKKDSWATKIISNPFSEQIDFDYLSPFSVFGKELHLITAIVGRWNVNNLLTSF